MLKINKYNAQGEETGKATLPKALFSVESKKPQALLYEVINLYLANQRQGTTSVKTRSEVKGSGRKLYRQKGTGNARAGNARTPVRVGGGMAFGPKPKDWTTNIPKKKKRLALKLALTQRANAKQVALIESLDFEKPDTKSAKAILEKITPERSKTLILMKDNDQNVIRSFSNLPYVKTDKADSIFAYEILNCNFLLITQGALDIMKEVFTK
jgi:large subunit ribosomal protein L4